MMKLSEELRRAVKESGLRRVRICEAAKLDQSALSRFMSGERGLSMADLDRLAGFLRVKVTVLGPRKGKRP